MQSIKQKIVNKRKKIAFLPLLTKILHINVNFVYMESRL